MKVITPKEDKKVTQPITIEFSGQEVQQLLGLVGAMTIEDFESLVKQPGSLSIKKFSITADQLDGFTDNLFEVLIDHVERD